MTMFDKFKQLGQLNKMRQQAMKLQKELEQIKEMAERGGMKVVVKGDQTIDYILDKNGEERRDLVDLLNEALKKVQKESAKKMLEMGGGLSVLLGGMK